MFDVGFWELSLIGVMALVILGPERLPKAVRTAGLWVGKARRMVADVKRDIKAELDAEEMAQLKAMGEDIKAAGESLKGEVDTVTQSVNKSAAEMDQAIADAMNGLDEDGELVTSPAPSPSPAKKPAKKKAAKKTAKKAAKKATKKKVAKKKVAKKAAKKAPRKSDEAA